MEYVIPCIRTNTLLQHFPDFVVAKVTPTIHTRLGYKMFLMFAALNIGVMAPFSLYVLRGYILFQSSPMTKQHNT